MKARNILCLLVFIGLFIVSCTADKPSTEKSDSIAQPETVIKWLTYPGQPEKPTILLISGDEEYRSEEALPQLAKILSTRHGFNCTVLFSQNPDFPGIVDPNYSGNIPGLEKLRDADLAIFFTRFRALPDEQMAPIDAYLKAGKPVIGMRTATHAFMFKESDIPTSYAHYGNYYEGDDEWNGGFGRLVLGEHWIRHHGKHGDQSTLGLIATGSEDHPILNGIKAGSVWGPTDVYGVRLPLPGDAQPILLGQTIDRTNPKDASDPRWGMRPTDNALPGPQRMEDDSLFDPNDPMMPVAWVKSYQLPEGQQGRAFVTTMGASTDLLAEGMRRLLVNAVFWSLDQQVPQQAVVDLVGTYNPSGFAFQTDEFWKEKNISVADLK